MHYQIEFLPSALEQLRMLPKDARRLIGGKLDRAQHNLALDSWCMMLATEKRFMSNATSTAKPPGNWTQLNKQLAQAKTLLRQMSQTIEDIEDARTIERAKRTNSSKARIPWTQVKRELQLD